MPQTDPAELGDHVRRVVAAAAGPVTLAAVKKQLTAAGVKLGVKAGAADGQIQAILDADAHAHPTKGKGQAYWHRPPQSAAERVEAAVRAKVADLGADPVTAAKLGKPSPKKAADLPAFDATIERLIAEGKLHRYGAKYGTRPPPVPAWYETESHKKEFAAAVKAVRGLIAGGIDYDRVITALRAKLAPPAAPPPPPAVPVVVPPPAVVPAPLDVTAALPGALRQAYDHLCQFVEFHTSRLVEIPRLYHELVKRLPAATVAAFHAELWALGGRGRVELHELNEVAQASEPDLALRRDGRLYYYARWK